MTHLEELHRIALLHGQAAELLRADAERHESEAKRLREEAAAGIKGAGAMTFTPSRRFRRDYDRTFRKDPLAANLLLLMAELADARGKVRLGPSPEVEIQQLMTARFDDLRAYQLPGGPR